MSDSFKHECGIAMVRLRKPLAYYKWRYGTALWGFHKLFLLMEKQHNRGQDGVGIGCIKQNTELGDEYVHRVRSDKANALSRIFQNQLKNLAEIEKKEKNILTSPELLKQHFDFGGEILMGHLRYGTSGEFREGCCHPYLRRSNWQTRTLMLLGNFNMANSYELNKSLADRGQHPIFSTDTQAILEEIGFHLDEMHTRLYQEFRGKNIQGREAQKSIAKNLDIKQLIKDSASDWDGGYAICGGIGNGDVFAFRDPQGIRPCYVLIDDEVVAIASERVPLMTVFTKNSDEIKELPAGGLLIVNNDGEIRQERFAESKKTTPCSFERIYFSRGNDPEIYRERKALGAMLVDPILEKISEDYQNSIFSFIPNTAEIAYQGMMEDLHLRCRKSLAEKIWDFSNKGSLTKENLDELLAVAPRTEKIAHKDIKLRTFIAQKYGRTKMASHVYDVTYGVVDPKDTLVILDDSIVRGTTLKQSILKILATTNPKKIIVCSTAPQIRYPDFYGIDMSELGNFIAFQAAISLHRAEGRQLWLDEVAEKCKQELTKPPKEQINQVKLIYQNLKTEEISKKIAELVYPEKVAWQGELEMIFQTIEDLHQSLSQPCGDWYFTGNYPTPAGTGLVNRSYLSWFKGEEGRNYDLPLN